MAIKDSSNPSDQHAQAPKEINQTNPGSDAANATAKLQSDAQTAANGQVKPAEGAQAGDSATKVLPSVSIQPDVMPWAAENSGIKQHMGYEQAKSGIVHNGEGPFSVAERVLGKNAPTTDVWALTNAMESQYKAETSGNDPSMSGLRIGHSLLNESNISQVLDRIPDQATKQRIADELKTGWATAEQPTTVAFGGKDGKPDETRPSTISDPAAFEKDLAAAAIDVGQEALRLKGNCAQGAREAFNELPGWHIDGGSVDKSINQDPNGWRSGLQMALDLEGTGLFTEEPLSKLGVNNLKDGYIVGRYHNAAYVKAHPSWGGEDMGDIDIKTSQHTPEADGRIYFNSFVLIPKTPTEVSSPSPSTPAPAPEQPAPPAQPTPVPTAG